MDTRAQNTWKEQIEKEAYTRIQSKMKKEENKDDNDEWFIRGKYEQNNNNNTNNNINNEKKIPTIKDIKYPARSTRENQSEQIAKLTRQLRESSANLLSDMKEPDQKKKDLLYDGFTKEEKGRYSYLKARKTEDPEAKYEYPLVSSFEYGWKLGEVQTAYKTPVNGRSKIVEESFYRRNGIF